MRSFVLPLVLLPALAAAQSGPALRILSSTRAVSAGGSLTVFGEKTLTDAFGAQNDNLVDWVLQSGAGVSSKAGNGAGVFDLQSRYERSRVSFYANADANCSRAELTTDANGSVSLTQDTRFRVDRVSYWTIQSDLGENHTPYAGGQASVEFYEGDRLLYSGINDGLNSASFRLRPSAIYRLKIVSGSSAYLIGDYSEETFAAANATATVTLAPTGPGGSP